MDRSNIIRLISRTYEKNEYGVSVPKEASREVFCDVTSVTRSEFFEGARSGLNPEYRFTMFFADYHGEPIVEYEGKRYAIYRVYQARTDTLEVYVERRGGTNGEENSHGPSFCCDSGCPE